MRATSYRICTAAAILAASGACFGQDSVPTVPGGSDALDSYAATQQRTRYVVDAVGVTTSWNSPILVAPIIKSSRDIDPTFKTQILGSAAVSPSLAQNVAFSSESYALWTAAGQGVHPTANAAPASSVAMTGFSTQFGVALSDLALSPTNVVGATVGRDSSNLARLFVERVCAAQSRTSAGAPDTSTLSLGSVDALGNVVLRADSFNSLSTTTNRLLGDNIVRVNLDARGGFVNTLSASGSINIAADVAATTYIVTNEATPTNVPASLLQPGIGPFALVFDFTSRLRTGSSTANLVNLASAHLAAGTAGHRGNPSFSPLTPLGGSAGTIATLAVATTGSPVKTLDAAALNFGSAGAPPSIVPGSARAMTLPSPISSGTGFTANVGGAASFKQYLSQVPFRGASGLVGVGTNASGQLVLAATANETGVGDFIAVATSTSPSTSTWTVAAYPNQPVLSGPGGTAIGNLNQPTTTLSAPAVDRLGNVYFVGTWKPNLTPVATGLFKAVTTPSGYQLELLLTTGQTITGANSTRPYTIQQLSLTDSDSLASGAFHAGQLIQEQAPNAQTTDPANIRAMGGLIVNTVLRYNNAGVSEDYETVLFVGPTAGQTFCPADFNMSGGVTVQDIFDFLAAYFSGDLNADFNDSGGITVQDIFDFLAAYFTPCP